VITFPCRDCKKPIRIIRLKGKFGRSMAVDPVKVTLRLRVGVHSLTAPRVSLIVLDRETPAARPVGYLRAGIEVPEWDPTGAMVEGYRPHADSCPARRSAPPSASAPRAERSRSVLPGSGSASGPGSTAAASHWRSSAVAISLVSPWLDIMLDSYAARQA
jgi:hypothetical protein